MGWSRFFRRKHWDAERAHEIEQYLETETADNIARGMPANEARWAARRKLGNPTLVREEIYRMNSMTLIETVWQDLRYGLRVLRNSPGFTLTAILSLALGIGANSTVYSVVHAVLIRSLPYPEPNRLLRVQPLSGGELTMPQMEFWKAHSASFASACAHQGTSDRLLTAGGKTAWIRTMSVTADFFGTLGVAPALGHELTAEETRPGGPLAIVLSNGLWRREFGADRNALGRTVSIDNANFTIVGVLPRGFWFPETADAFVPLRSTGTVGDFGTNTEMIARLKPGVTLAQARAEMTVLSESYRKVASNLEDRQSLTVESYRDWVVGDVRTNLLLLFGAVGFLLLIACFNLASLLLARIAGRRKEIAMRIALGSSRSRLLRQFLIENTLLTMAGALAGLIGARALLETLVASIPFTLPASERVRLDAPVLAFTLAVALATSVAFSVAPFLTASRLDLQEALKAGGRTAGTAIRQRARHILVVSEVALSVTLLVAAGLLMQTLYRMHREQLGFDPHGLMTFSTPTTAQQRSNLPALRTFEAILLDRLLVLPGVQGAAAVSVLPLTTQRNFPTEHAGHPDHDIGGMEIRVITPSYLQLMRIPLVRGRGFSASDTAKSTPVILVNETVARRWWGSGSPLRDRVAVGRLEGRDLSGGSEPLREVVGVVADTKSVYLKAKPRPTVYLPAEQTPWYDSGMNWVVRGNFSADFGERLRQTVAEIDPGQRVDRIRSMDEIVSATTADSRFNAWLFSSFAGLALALAAIGVYGLLAFSVSRRTNEIGTRMALGASRAEVLRLVLKQGILLVTIGLGLGLGGALVVARSLKTLLFGVTSTDPISFAAVSVLLLSVGLLASYLPARRATRIDPMMALRDE